MNRKKILVPLATLAAAGAVAIGSGATFDSTSANTISSVTSGTLLQSNSKNGAQIFGLTNMKPGDVVNGTVTITNSGSLPATFALTEVASNNAFTANASGVNYLSLSITDAAGATVYNGDFGGLADGVKNPLGDWTAGESRTYTFSVKLAQDAPNSQQNRTAGASYQWDAVQLDAQTFNQ
jgi:spore coat-associated protein N